MRHVNLGILVTAFSILFASPAISDTINIHNPRPITPVNAGDGPGMQAILDKAFSCTGCVNPILGQQSAGKWSAANKQDPDVRAIFTFEFAGNGSLNGLGLWSGTDTSAVSEHAIFGGISGPGARAQIEWLGSDSGIITSLSGAGVNSGAFTGISLSGFGFYLDGPGGKFYTLDQLNSGNAAQSLAYRGPSANSTTWMISFEDTALGDRDFNDAVIIVNKIAVAAVPEPEVYAMLVAGLGLMGFVARRRRQQTGI